MSGSFLSPNMNLVIPVVGTETGPNWASDINASLIILDGHTHSAGSGIQITPSGLNINSDLSFLLNNATSLRSVRFASQSAPLSGMSDLGCLYESAADLYYNDGNGNQVRITQSGSVSGSAGTITGLPSGTASASFQSASGTFQFQQETATAANLDVGTVIIRYPGSYPTPSGNCILLEAPSSLASQYTLTLPALPAQTNVMTIGTGGIISSVTWDTVGSNMTSVGADAIGASMDSTGANAVANSRTRNVGPSVGIGGIALSSSSGNSQTTSLTYVAISNCTVQITTTGRPIAITLFPDGGGTDAFVGNTSGGAVHIRFYDTSLNQVIGAMNAGANNTSVPTGTTMYYFPAAGTYTIQAQYLTSFGTAEALYVRLMAYEL